MSELVRPPAVPGTHRPTLGDAWRIAWWSGRGLMHGARHGRGSDRLTAVVVLVVWVLCSPLVLPAMAVLIRAEQWWPWSRWYLSRDRDAVLAIRARRGQWRIAEHVCSRPGTGQGRALRDVLLPALSPVAIEEGLTITMNAASPRLAKTYLELLPGLRDVGPAFPRGRRLRLDPQEERRTS